MGEGGGGLGGWGRVGFSCVTILWGRLEKTGKVAEPGEPGLACSAAIAADLVSLAPG